MSKFSNSRGNGFHLTFDNKWTISVQFGGGHYCDNYDKRWNFAQVQAREDNSIRSSTAEIAVWNNSKKTNGLIPLENDNVRGYTTANEVAEVIHLVSTADSDLTSERMTKRLSKVWKK